LLGNGPTYNETYSAVVGDFIKDQQFAKNLPKDRVKKSSKFSGGWWWRIGDQQVLMNM
jgi:hypothetical protein